MAIDRRITQLPLEVDADATSQRRTTQLVLEVDARVGVDHWITQIPVEVDVDGANFRQITQLMLEVELAEPYTPSAQPLMPEEPAWTPALLPPPIGSNAAVQASFWGPWIRVVELRRRITIKVLRR